MANAKAKLYYTSSEHLDSLPIRNGNIVFAPESKTFCLDMQDQRFMYTTIRTCATEQDLRSIPFPVEGFYFVEDTRVFWRWNGAWSAITPSNLKPVVYGVTLEDLPSIGQSETLYYTDDGIYHWKNGKYNLIGNVNTWDVLNS